MDRSTNEIRLAPGTRAITISFFAIALVTVTLVPASASILDRLEPIDDVMPGQRSAQQVCADEAGTECVNATLETAPFACDGDSVETFHCNITYYLNLTITGMEMCGNATVNISEDLAVAACTGQKPVETATSGPVTVTYNGTNTSQIANATAWVCHQPGSKADCERWKHDAILIPSWREWRPKPDEHGGAQSLKRICLGTSASLQDDQNPAPGCVDAVVSSHFDCESLRTEDCDLKVYAQVFVDWEAARAVYLCGVTSVDFERGGDALACGFQSGDRDLVTAGDRSVTIASSRAGQFVDSRHYDEDDIPYGSDMVVIEAEACVYAFRVNATEYCETFHHVAYIPGHSCCTLAIENEVNYWVTRANHTQPPSVYP